MKKTNLKKSKDSSTFLSCLIIVLVTLTLFNLSFYLFAKPSVSYVTKDPTDKKISFWNTFLMSHPSYFEGWIELAQLNLQLGNDEEAKIAYMNAWSIDPNAMELKILKNEFGN